MQQRPLGLTGLNVSLICLGTMTYGEQNTEAEGHEQMDYAFENGINFFDTAELYPIPPKAGTHGETERIIGTWMKARKTRKQVVIATKVVGRTGMTWFRKDGSPGELNRKQIEEAIDKSLKNLQTDTIDLYQLHWPDRPVSLFGSNDTVFKEVHGPENSITSVVEVLKDIQKAGKIRHFGLSNESAWGTMNFVREAEQQGLSRPVSIQNAYNLVNRTFEIGLAEIAMREHVGLLAYSPLAQGYLTGKYQNGAMPPQSRKTLFGRMQRYETQGASEAFDAYISLARQHGLDPTQMALAFCATRPFMTSVIIGATKMEQLKTNIAAATLQISPEIEAQINAIHQWRGNPCP
jgi:aryl-alcohol dehydrogenase-like predicted oxidoreductase